MRLAQRRKKLGTEFRFYRSEPMFCHSQYDDGFQCRKVNDPVS
jgi:hypothetical protein